MVVLLRVVDAEADRHLLEERRAGGGDAGDRKVVADAKGPLVHAVDAPLSVDLTAFPAALPLPPRPPPSTTYEAL